MFSLLVAVLFFVGCGSQKPDGTTSSNAAATTDAKSSGEAANWHETLDSALQAAKAENKLVFVDFSAEW
jgi:thiol:disulfide interchange protein